MATATVLPFARASRSYRIGPLRVRFLDLGLDPIHRLLTPHSGIRNFGIEWEPRDPTPAERQAYARLIQAAAFDALKALGGGTLPMLLGDLP